MVKKQNKKDPLHRWCSRSWLFMWTSHWIIILVVVFVGFRFALLAGLSSQNESMHSKLKSSYIMKVLRQRQ